MTIRTIDRANLRHATAEFIKTLETKAAELGLEISGGGGTYGGTTGSIKLNISVKNTGSGKSGAEQEFRMYARTYGIDPNAFGKEFVFNRRKPWNTYRVSGVNPGSPKYRFSAIEVHTGRPFKFTPETLKQHFPLKKDAA